MACDRPAVAMPQRNDLRSTRVQLGHDQGSLIGFGTAVRKVALLQATRCNLGKLLGKLHNRLINVERGGMLHLLHLRLDGRIDLGLAMTNAHREYTTEEVQVRAPFGVPDAQSLQHVPQPTAHGNRYWHKAKCIVLSWRRCRFASALSCVLLLMGWK